GPLLERQDGLSASKTLCVRKAFGKPEKLSDGSPPTRGRRTFIQRAAAGAAGRPVGKQDAVRQEGLRQARETFRWIPAYAGTTDIHTEGRCWSGRTACRQARRCASGRPSASQRNFQIDPRLRGDDG